MKPETILTSALSEPKAIYFVGAGGIGMAALERYFLSRGVKVGGYDRTPSELTDALIAEGVEINFDDSVEAIPEAFRDPQTTLVVYTPAVPSEMPQLHWFRTRGFEVVKRAVVLGLVTRNTDSLCFAGTHGKTTTSSMAAHILHNSAAGCVAFLGGVLRNYKSNFILDPGSHYSVIEADEFDRSFHQLRPRIAVVTSCEPDHLDIYGTEEAYYESFTEFTRLIRPGGTLIMHEDLRFTPDVAEGVNILSYGRNSGDYHAANITYGEGTLKFDLVTPERTIKDINLGVPVDINIENAIAAIAAVMQTGEVDDDTIQSAMASFMGADRRFSLLYKEDKQGGRVIISDYAHHPGELSVSIESVRKLYPGRKLTVAFQPHLYTRTRDFADGFAASLSKADRLILLDIYPAREQPIPGVTSEIIFDKVTSPEKILICKDLLPKTIKNTNFDVLLVAGAGDINNCIPEIIESC